MYDAKVLVVSGWRDPRVALVEDHAMMILAPGVYYHSRLNAIIIIPTSLDVTFNDDLVLDAK